MPLVHISMQEGKSNAYRQAIFNSIAEALHGTFDVPNDNHFMTLTEHSTENFRYSASYLGIDRSDDLVFIQISAMDTRSVEQKKSLYQQIALRLGENPKLRPQDVFINLLEGARENWSLGHGLAQYAS